MRSSKTSTAVIAQTDKCRQGCTPHCEDCVNVSISEVRKDISKIQSTLLKYGQEFCQYKNWGYNCPTLKEEEVSYLGMYIETLGRLVQALRNNVEPCVTHRGYLQIKDTLSKYLGLCEFLPGRTVEVDNTHYHQFAIENPLCVPKEYLKASIDNFCENLDLSVEALPILSEAIYVFKISIDPVKWDCLIPHFVATKQAYAYPEYKVSSLKIADCKVDYQALVKAYTDCELSLDSYVKLRECELSQEFISTAISCGFSFEIRSEEEKTCPILVSSVSGLSLNICEVLTLSVEDLKKSEFNVS